jgi:hypothetical protein
MIVLRLLALLVTLISFLLGAVIGYARTPRSVPYTIRYVTKSPTPSARGPHDGPPVNSQPPPSVDSHPSSR